MKLQSYLRGLFYATTITLGIFLTLTELDKGNINNFLRYTIVVGSIFLVELYAGWSYRNQVMMQKQINLYLNHANSTQLLHHVVIPLATYISILGFAVFNRQQHLRTPILLLALLGFTVLFVNLRAFYEKQEKLTEQTYYVYDLLKLLIVFGTSDLLLNWGQLTSQPVLSAMMIPVLIFLLLLMILMRNKRLEGVGIGLSTLVSVAIGIATWVATSNLGYTPLQAALLTTLSYYIGAALIFHLMQRDLSWQIVVEYIAVGTIAMSILTSLA